MLDDVDDGEEYNDTRVRPDYDIFYQQSVTAEDMFINLNMTTNSFDECQVMVIKVTLPGVQSIKQVTLDMDKHHMLIRTAKQ